MDTASKSTVSALKRAIKREERTALAYADKARKARNPVVIGILESLSKQETGHAKKLQRALDMGVDLSGLGRKGKRQLADLRVVNRDVREIEKESEPVKVLRRALKAERNSVLFYRSLENIYQGLEVAVLFRKLAEEEERHQARLERALPRT